MASADTEWGQASVPADSRVNEEFRNDGVVVDVEEVEIAIVGGGLAGLAVAIGLSRAGIACKVYERAPQLRSKSQGILAIQPNGMSALQSIHPDLPAMIREAGCERQELIITTINADGTTSDTVHQTGEEDKKKYGQLKVGLTWHKMQQLLASLLPLDIVVPGRSLQSFEEEDEGIVLHFQDIYSNPRKRFRVKASAAIAADGVFSVARRQVLSNMEDGPIFFGQINWATVIDTIKLPENVHPPNAVHFFMYEGEPARWISMINDGGHGQSFWQFRVADPKQALGLSRNFGRGGLGLPGIKEALLPIAKPCTMVYETIKRIPEEQIFERSIVGRLPAATWLSKGGLLALVGDAAHGMHPNIAQGANSSFQSAAAVVQSLVEQLRVNTLGNSVTVRWKDALRDYERQRKPKADIVQRFANMMGCVQATGAKPLSRELQLKMIDWIVTEKQDHYPSPETLDTIFAFDPLSQNEVSWII